MEERMTREKMAHLGPRFWLVARDKDHPVEIFTMDCGGAESLPVFSHEEEAGKFLDLGGAGDGWRTRESSAGEIVSLLFGLCSRVSSVALDPSPLMTPEMLDLIKVDQGRFVDLITAPGEKKHLPRSRWVMPPGIKNRGVA
jgi:hypothetical protein